MRGLDPGEPFVNDAYTQQQPVFRANTERVQARVTAELAAIRTELGRMDAKTNMLLAVCSLLLGGAATFLAAKPGALPLAIQVGAGLALACVAASLELLLRTVRPNTRGNFGFRRWAKAASGQGVLAELESEHAADDDLTRATELYLLSALLDGKYAAVRKAVNLLFVAVTLAEVTAVSAVWIR